MLKLLFEEKAISSVVSIVWVLQPYAKCINADRR